MVEFEVLKQLEKAPTINIRETNIIAQNDFDDETGCTTVRVLENNGKYYYHKMHNGEMQQCFEISLSWKPFSSVWVFAFTPDNLHEVTFDVREMENPCPNDRKICPFETKKIKEDLIQQGFKFAYKGKTLEYINAETVAVNGKNITVVSDGGYVVKYLKSKVKAIGGAKGLYRVLENEMLQFDSNLNIVEKYCCSIFTNIFNYA